MPRNDEAGNHQVALGDHYIVTCIRRSADAPSGARPADRGVRRFLRVLGVACAATLVVLAAGCSAHSSSSPPVKVAPSATGSGYAGDVLDPAEQLSTQALSASFTASTGKATTLGALQKGHLMLLYFGYTNCPDICPTTMADLGQALRNVPAQIRFKTQVVFVTSDPARDTPPVLAKWLAHFDTGLPLRFVGLHASLARTDSIAKSVGVPLRPPVKEPDGAISVEHGTQTLAFVDGKAGLAWLAGTTPADYASDITELASKAALS